MNIVLFMSDSMDGRAMTCAGNAAVPTPNMDRLAQRGVLFNNNYCNSPQCCPSRASMWSGRFVHNCEAWNNHKGLEPGDETFLTRLESAGYVSDFQGKTDYQSGGHSLGARVLAWTRAAAIPHPQKGRPVGVISDADGKKGKRKSAKDWDKTDKTVAAIRKFAADPKTPFLAYTCTGIPHPGYSTTREYYDRIDPAKVTLPPVEDIKHPVLRYASLSKNCDGVFADEEILKVRRVYYAMVAELDDMLGKVMDTVDGLGITDSTYIICTSDHGDMNMEHKQYLKNSMYEASARVPMIVAGPGIQQGVVVEDPTSLVDVFPTLMDMAALETPDGLDGHSLAPALTGRGDTERPDWAFSEYHSNMLRTGSFMLRRGQWKYITYGGYEPRLFDLANDPDEMNDLAKQRPDVVRAMDAKMREICDYEAVDAKAKAYDRRAFVEWRAGLDDKAYEKAMKGMYKGWTDEDQKAINAWLEG